MSTSTINPDLYLVGATAPSILFDTPDLPRFDYPERLEAPRRPTNIFSNIPVIIVTALVFITIISWFNVLSHWYEDVFHPPDDTRNKYRTTKLALGYALLVTFVSIFVGIVIYLWISSKNM